MSKIAVVARVRVKQGRVDDYLSAFASLLEQVDKESGTLLYLLQRDRDNPLRFWTSELYADDVAFEVHRTSEVHEAAAPIFGEVIEEADVMIGEVVMGKGPGMTRSMGPS